MRERSELFMMLVRLGKEIMEFFTPPYPWQCDSDAAFLSYEI